jgi:hypothetical protein
MGLDTSHDCWHGSYSWFAEWRCALAKAAGRRTERAIYGDRDVGERHAVDAKQYHPRTFLGWWDEPPYDPLDVLLVHSDAEGWIFPEHAEPLGKRLDELAPLLAEEWRDLTHQFALGLRNASERWDVVRFA